MAQQPRFEDEESAVDPELRARLLVEAEDAVAAAEIDDAEGKVGLDHGHGADAAALPMAGNERAEIDVGEPVGVRDEKRTVLQPVADGMDAPARRRVDARLRTLDLHLRRPFRGRGECLDLVRAIARAQREPPQSLGGEDPDDVPDDRHPTDLDERLRQLAVARMQSSPAPPAQDHDPHRIRWRELPSHGRGYVSSRAHAEPCSSGDLQGLRRPRALRRADRRRRRRGDRARVRARARRPGRQAGGRAAHRPRARHAPDRAGARRALPRRAWWPRARTCSTPGWSAPRCSTYLVGSRDLDGGLMCTASHNPKAYTGAKLVERGALALSGDTRHRRDPPRWSRGGSTSRAAAPGSRGGRRRLRRVPGARARVRSTRRAIRPLKVVLDGGNGMAGPMVGPILEAARALELVPTYWEPDGEFPDHEPNPLLRGEPPLHHRQGALRGRRPRHRLGRRRRPLLLHRRRPARFVDGDFLTALLAESILREAPGRRRSSTTCARRARCADTVERGRRPRARQPRRPRVLQAPHARRGRRVRRRGLRPLLLRRLLQRGLGHDPGAADPRAARRRGPLARRAARAATARATSSRARSTPRSPTRTAKMRRDRASATPTPRSSSSTASRSTTRTGTSTCGPRTPSRCCASASRAWSPRRTWSAKRDEVLALIRS